MAFYLALMLSALAQGAQAATLTVRFEALRAEGGQVAIALFSESQAKGFPDEAKPILSTLTPVAKPKSAIATLQNLAAGKYALAAYQDENNDGTMNRDSLGIPSEPFGFSQNPMIFFGAPGFSRSAFELGAEESKEIVIRLKTF